MRAFSLWKQLKKRLRRERRPQWILGSLLAGLIFVSGTVISGQAHAQGALHRNDPAPASEIIGVLEQQAAPVQATIQYQYICGTEIQNIGLVPPQQAIALIHQHPDWQASLQADGSLQLVAKLEQFSPECRGNVYISVDKSGYLALFMGPPKKDKAVRTFFQLDVSYMESSLPKDQLQRLENGIRVTDLEEYNSVLSTFSDYAIEPTEDVLKQVK